MLQFLLPLSITTRSTYEMLYQSKPISRSSLRRGQIMIRSCKYVWQYFTHSFTLVDECKNTYRYELIYSSLSRFNGAVIGSMCSYWFISLISGTVIFVTNFVREFFRWIKSSEIFRLYSMSENLRIESNWSFDI